MNARSWLHNIGTCIVAVVAVGYGAIFNTTTSWLVADLALVLVGVSVISLLWPLSRLRVVAVDHRVAAYSPITFKLTPAAPVFGLVITANGQTIPLNRKRRGVFKAGLPRGVHEQIPLIARAYAPLGLFTKVHQLRLKQPLVVGPQPQQRLAHDIHQALAAHQQAQAMAQTANGDFDQLRPYRVGDPLNTINWKLTAAQGTMLRQTFRDPLDTTWWGACYGQADPAFERRLGVFTTLRHSQLWPQSFYLGETVQPHLTWTELATFKPVAAPAVLPLPPGVGLMVFAGATPDYQSLQDQYPRHPLLVVRITNDEFTLDLGGDAHG